MKGGEAGGGARRGQTAGDAGGEVPAGGRRSGEKQGRKSGGEGALNGGGEGGSAGMKGITGGEGPRSEGGAEEPPLSSSPREWTFPLPPCTPHPPDSRPSPCSNGGDEDEGTSSSPPAPTGDGAQSPSLPPPPPRGALPAAFPPPCPSSISAGPPSKSSVNVSWTGPDSRATLFGLAPVDKYSVRVTVRRCPSPSQTPRPPRVSSRLPFPPPPLPPSLPSPSFPHQHSSLPYQLPALSHLPQPSLPPCSPALPQSPPPRHRLRTSLTAPPFQPQGGQGRRCWSTVGALPELFTSATELSITGLEPGQEYSLALYTHNSAGSTWCGTSWAESPHWDSPPGCLRTLEADASPPGPPRNLRVLRAGWTAVSVR